MNVGISIMVRDAAVQCIETLAGNGGTQGAVCATNLVQRRLRPSCSTSCRLEKKCCDSQLAAAGGRLTASIDWCTRRHFNATRQ
jgi:hypothetical protein